MQILSYILGFILSFIKYLTQVKGKYMKHHEWKPANTIKYTETFEALEMWDTDQKLHKLVGYCDSRTWRQA